jgi:hypothetical protein
MLYNKGETCILNNLDFILRGLSTSQPLTYFIILLHEIFDHIKQVTNME